jgi:hypothetical protein
MPTENDINKIAEQVADSIISKLPELRFDRKYLIQSIIEIIEITTEHGVPFEM